MYYPLKNVFSKNSSFFFSRIRSPYPNLNEKKTINTKFARGEGSRIAEKGEQGVCNSHAGEQIAVPGPTVYKMLAYYYVLRTFVMVFVPILALMW